MASSGNVTRGRYNFFFTKIYYRAIEFLLEEKKLLLHFFRRSFSLKDINYLTVMLFEI